MAISQTNLTAAISATDLTLAVASATGFTVGRPVRIDNEMIGAVLEVNGLSIKVRGRGWDGTAAKAHAALAKVSVGDPADFPSPTEGTSNALPPTDEAQVSYDASGAIAIPDKDTTIILNKATAAAMTLAGPSAAQDGVKLTIVSVTAAAHTVTYTAGFAGNTTSSDVATFGAAIGNSMTIQAINGTWVILALNGVTVA